MAVARPSARRDHWLRGRRGLLVRIRQHAWGYLFLAPMLLLVAAFVIYPIIGSAYYALYNWSQIGHPTLYVGMRHFRTVAADPFFWNAFKNTLIYTAALVPIQLTLALTLALVLNSTWLRFASFYRAVYFLPVVTSMAVVGVVLGLLFARMSSSFPRWMVGLGWVNPVLGIVNDPRLALPAIIIIGIWHTLGINMVYFMAALQTVPREMYEAAEIDGAGSRARFMHITIPMIKPIGTVILFFAILGSMRVFDIVWVLTKGGPYYATDVVSTYIYSFAFTSTRGGSEANYGYASAAALFQSVLVMGITLLQLALVSRARGQQVEHRVQDGNAVAVRAI